MVNTPALHTRMSRGAPSQAAANERTDAREARSSGRTSSAGRGSPAAAASAARAAMSLRPLSRDRQARTTEGRECRWGVGGHVRAGGQPRRPQAPPPVSPHRTARAAAGQGGRCLPANTTVDEEGGRWRGWAGWFRSARRQGCTGEQTRRGRRLSCKSEQGRIPSTSEGNTLQGETSGKEKIVVISATCVSRRAQQQQPTKKVATMANGYGHESIPGVGGEGVNGQRLSCN